VRRALILLWIVFLSGSLSACDPREWFVCSIGACGELLDTRPPFPPQNPRAVAFSRGVALDWTASYASDVTKYYVYRSTTSGSGRTRVAETTTTSYRDTGLANGTTYYYVIRAADFSDRESTVSREVSATPQGGLAPAPPASLTATASVGAVDLMWAESFTAVKYHVLRSTSAGHGYVEIGSTSGTSYHDGSVQGGTTYFYVVTAENAEGSASALSNEATASPGGLSNFGFAAAWSGGFDGLEDVATSGVTRVFASEGFGGGQRVRAFTPSGTLVGPVSAPASSCDFVWPRGVATDAAGNVYVADQFYDCVAKVSPTGTVLATYAGGQLDDPSDVAIDPEGDVWVADSGHDRVVHYGSAGNFIGALGTGQLDDPRGIAVDRNFNVFVADTGHDRVVRFTGNTMTAWGSPGSGPGQLSRPWGIAVERTGRVWVADSGNDRVQAFSSAGLWLTWFGGSGSGDGRFSEPRGLDVDCAGNLYVADRGNARVQKFGPASSSPCGVSFAGAFVSRAFSGSFVATKSSPGKVTGFAEKGARQQGTFNVRGAGRGRWYALFDASADPLKLTARATGKLLARMGSPPTRDACLSFTVDVKDGTVSGRFSGGARGSFKQKLGSNRAWKVTGSGSPGRASTTACRAVRRAFGLR
jgi:NHL repeat